MIRVPGTRYLIPGIGLFPQSLTAPKCFDSNSELFLPKTSTWGVFVNELAVHLLSPPAPYTSNTQRLPPPARRRPQLGKRRGVSPQPIRSNFYFSFCLFVCCYFALFRRFHINYVSFFCRYAWEVFCNFVSTQSSNVVTNFVARHMLPTGHLMQADVVVGPLLVSYHTPTIVTSFAYHIFFLRRVRPPSLPPSLPPSY